jgi:hypothetical protein
MGHITRLVAMIVSRFCRLRRGCCLSGSPGSLAQES